MSRDYSINPNPTNDQQQWIKPELQVLSINESTLGVATDTVDGTPGTTSAS